MKKHDLLSKTVAELKALAKKHGISLSTGAKKADIVKAVAKGVSGSSKSKGKASVKAVRTSQARKTAAKMKPSKRTAGATRTAAKKKPSASKQKPTVKRSRPSARSVGRTPLRGTWQITAAREEPLRAQERVADAKYYTGTVEQRPSARFDPLTHEYGTDRIALMARDPYVAFAYWELLQARLEKERSWFGWDSKLCVRVYDVTGVLFDGKNAQAYFDQEVYDRVGSWYFDFGRPMHSFCADLGLLAPNGRFLTMIRSNAVTMPRDGVSDVMDEEWLLADEDFMKLYGGSVSGAGGFSSQQVQELISQRRMLKITSPGMFSKPKAKK